MEWGERFPSPLIAAAVHGNNEALFALAFEAAKGVLGTDRLQDLDKVKQELHNMPRFSSDLTSQRKKPLNLLSLICSLKSPTLLDAL